MVGAHLNLNGSRDITTPNSGVIRHRWDSPCYGQLSTRFEISNTPQIPKRNHYEETKYNTKCGKWGCLGVVMGQSRSLVPNIITYLVISENIKRGQAKNIAIGSNISQTHTDAALALLNIN